ncbi:MAG: (deoxy)nucleoside triphosphate pyrophosphohydrolase [Ancrocorticia sp.]
MKDPMVVETKPKKRINVVGAIITDGSKVLAAQRSERMSLPGLWEFPGGKIEVGETPQKALQRELQEELLCEVEIGEQVESTEYEYDFGIVTLTTFYCKLIGREPRLTEHSAIRWVEATDLEQLPFAPADVPAVQHVAKDYMK